MIKLTSGLLLDPGTPELDEPLGILGWGCAGETLADHQRKRFLDRCVLAVGQPGNRFLLIFILEHGAEITGHARHDAGADSLDARLFDRFKHCAGVAPLGLVLGVNIGIVVGQPQRVGICKAAGDGNLTLGQIETRLGKLYAVSLKARRLRAECDIELGFVGNGLHGERKGPLEGSGWTLTILSHHYSLPPAAYEIETCTVDSGSSAPKQRW